MTDTAWVGWCMTAPGAPLERRDLPWQTPAAGEVVVEVAGCGVCHTDLSFLHLGVKTRHELPLVLGHEISGTVQAAGDGVDKALLGRPVVIPAVLPCGECDLCRAGHRRICRRQVMPGNDRDGGFASHVWIPARYLCPVPGSALASHALWELSVVADAVSTPFQAVKRSGLAPGEIAVCIGTGGIGVHGVQIAAAVGAKVVALDVDERKLEQAKTAGAHATLNVKDLPVKDVRKQVRGLVDELKGPAHLWKIFETSGTRSGQETAYALLGFGATLSVIGFTMDKVEVPLSNLMAYDAIAQGNWGSDATLYPELLEWVGQGKITVKPFVERHPLSRINQVFDDAHHGRLLKRAVMVPEGPR